MAIHIEHQQRSNVALDSVFLRDVAIKLNSHSTCAEYGRAVLYFTKAVLTCGYANKLKVSWIKL